MEEIKVQFGSGGNQLVGWNNHDAETPIEKPLPYGDNTVDTILCEHTCEHVSTPDFFRFLLECKRILKPGGSLYLSMPVLDRLSGEHARDIVLSHGHLAAYTGHSLWHIVKLIGFERYMLNAYRHEYFGHWKVIGDDKDELESFRIICVK